MAIERDEDARTVFRAAIRQYAAENVVVIDESGTHISLTRQRGYAPRGTRLVEATPRNRHHALTVIAALTVAGLRDDQAVMFEGGTTTAVFEAYITTVLAPTLVAGQIVVMDNLRAHKSARVQTTIEERGCTLVFLPTYSPDFSPIEYAFAKVKAHLRRIKARTKGALAAALRPALAEVTVSDARGYFRHCGYKTAQ